MVIACPIEAMATNNAKMSSALPTMERRMYCSGVKAKEARTRFCTGIALLALVYSVDGVPLIIPNEASPPLPIDS